MAKKRKTTKCKIKRKKEKGWFRSIFGRSFGFWDILLIAILGFAIWHKVSTEGWGGLLNLLGDWFIGGLIVAYVGTWLLRKTKR